MVNTALAIFVKTPVRSPLKTRLGASVGEQKALEFYTRSIAAIAETVKKSDVSPYWAVAEHDALNDEIWNAFATLHTGEGCLGTRQYNIYETLLKNHDQAILIGADAPQLSPAIISQTITALKNNEHVIGPANDGGYYLFAGKSSIPLDIWTNTPWSAENTRIQFIENLEKTPYELPPLTDIDTQQDLAALKSEMPNPMNAHQKALMDWIKIL